MKMDYQKIYQQISKKAHTEIYHFMKINQISADDYIFQTYFDFIVKKYKIKILEHYTLDSLILGITYVCFKKPTNTLSRFFKTKSDLLLSHFNISIL